MTILPPTLHVRTRVPLAGWAIAAAIAFFSLMSSVLHSTPFSEYAMPRGGQELQQKVVSHQAKV